MKKVEAKAEKLETAQSRAGFLHSSFCILHLVTSRILISLVRIYQLTLSPAKTFLFGSAGHCRFEPSCSQYAIEAVKTHGPLSGGWLAAKRICRCHPWGQCGEDPVPPKTLKPPFSFHTPRTALRVSRS